MGNGDANWSNIVLVATIIIVLVAVAKALFFLSIIAFIISFVVFLFVIYAGDSPDQILVIVLVLSLIGILIFGTVGLVFPNTETGSIIVNTSESIVYLDKTVDSAKKSAYISILESIAPLFPGEYMDKQYVVEEKINYEVSYADIENYTYQYAQSLNGSNLTDISISNIVRTDSENSYCYTKTCNIKFMMLNRNYNFRVNYDAKFLLIAYNQFDEYLLNMSVEQNNLSLEYKEPKTFVLTINPNIKEIPYKIKVIPDSLNVTFLENNNTLILNKTIFYNVNKTRIESRIENVTKTKQVYVVDSDLFELLVFMGRFI